MLWCSSCLLQKWYLCWVFPNSITVGVWNKHNQERKGAQSRAFLNLEAACSHSCEKEEVCSSSFMVFGFQFEDAVEYRNSKLELYKITGSSSRNKLNKHGNLRISDPSLLGNSCVPRHTEFSQTGRFMDAGNKSSWENAFCNLFPVTFLDCWELYSQQCKCVYDIQSDTDFNYSILQTWTSNK